MINNWELLFYTKLHREIKLTLPPILMHCKGCSFKWQICSWIFHEQKKRLNLSDKLFIVNYLLSYKLCMCTVFTNLAGILVVPWEEVRGKSLIFCCSVPFVSPHVFCGWNPALPHTAGCWGFPCRYEIQPLLSAHQWARLAASYG